MFFTQAITAEIERRARFCYFDVAQVRAWNLHRRGDELRLLTGWTWMARDGSAQRTGFKTISAAVRDAYYVLIQHREQPADVTRPKLVRLNSPAKKASEKSKAQPKSAQSQEK